MSSLRFLVALLSSICLIFGCAHGFLEEECFLQQGKLVNVYETASVLGCEYGEFDPKCGIASLTGGISTFTETSPCRSYSHFDTVFFIAQAVGISGEMAYWISAYSQAADFVQFMAVDSCGQAMNSTYWTPPMRGLRRTSTLTGQPIRHLGILYRGYDGLRGLDANGLAPNLNDTVVEGDLVNARNWAFNQTQLYCTLGLTEPSGGNFYNGTRCINSSQHFLDMTSPREVKGPIPTPPVNATLGDQVMQYDCIGDPTCMNPPYNLTNVWYTYQMADYINLQSNYSRLQNGQPVPEVIVRFGVYLHQLADRLSHFYCTNPPDTAMLGPRESDGAFYLSWNITSCQFVYHSTQHYWEQGVAPVLAPQTWSVLNYYFEEISAWAAEFRPLYPEWFNATATLLSQDTLVGDEANPGILATLAMESNVPARVKRFMSYLTQYGYAQVPGQELPCPTW